MITTILLDSKNKFTENVSLEYLPKQLSDRKSFIWLDMEDPNEEEFKILSDMFNFHPLPIEDCSNYTDVSKFDDFEDYLFIVIHGVLYGENNKDFKKHELDIFIGKNYLVTVHKDKMKTININLAKVKKNPSIMSKGVDFLLYNIMDELVDNYMPLLDLIENKIERLEDNVINGDVKDIMPEIVNNKREILNLKRSVGPQREIINKIARRDSAVITNKYVIYFRDVYDHIVRVNELIESNRERLGSIFEIYLSSISNRMNDIMKRLTLVATIFMPLTLIVGIYGMNFQIMPELKWHYGYFIVLGVMAFIGISLTIYFKTRKWF